MLLTKVPRGTRDILPAEAEKWRRIEEKARELCRLYRYGEIRTPIFEHTELFSRSVGEDTDIVSKEMYTFEDRGKRRLTLRPENTASVVRAYLEHNLHAAPQPVKLYYIGPMFRYDRPQAGRYRQFHQFGVEAFGSQSPALDAEIIHLADQLYRQLGLKDVALEINSVGCRQCRPLYREKLKDFFQGKLSGLCLECRQRHGTNTLRILDCKTEKCRRHFQDMPTLKANLCPGCSAHFESLQAGLDNLGLSFHVNPRLVRGLDYYTKTVFEFISPRLGAQSSLGGGGRYDDLVEVCGGPSTPGSGFAVGLERILLALEEEGVGREEEALEVYAAYIDVNALSRVDLLLKEMRLKNISCERDFLGRSLKAQLKQAGRSGARLTILLGGEELDQGKAIIKEMSSGEQETVPLANIIEAVLKNLGREV